MKRIPIVTIFILLWATMLWADGVMLPSDPNYPKDLLRNRVTKIYVRLHGQVAETVVYQEFVNEWHKKTDAVYSFPLPPDARATAFFYWHNDICYKAVLKVKEQAVNPGTGEGGVAALVNKYIGRNGIKVRLKDIPPGGIQKTQLYYISLCSYYQGEIVYQFPLDTQEFVKYPLDLLSVQIDLSANSPIQSYDLVSHPGWKVIRNDPDHVIIDFNQSKTYLNKNLEFRYTIPNDKLCVDFFSVANDTMDGHFVLIINPDETVDSTKILRHRVVFVLDKSSSMFGYKLDQSKAAIAQCLEKLKPQDYFNIVTFDYNVVTWQSQLVPASAANLQAAKNFLATIETISWGSNLASALQKTLPMFPDKNMCNSILLFTDGFSAIDPVDIENRNPNHVGIFCIGIGDELDRAKLEMTSLRNYGFVTYFNTTDNLIAGINRVFKQISKPMLINTNFEFGRCEAYQILPQKYPSVYQGNRFFITGRYKNPGRSAFSIAGTSTQGLLAYDFFLDFAAATDQNKFAESLWAKEMIDEIERQIAVFGESDSLKKLDIELSLKYNIRCKYTAYIADYETTAKTEIIAKGDNISLPKSYLIGNYPNPFNSSTTITIYLDKDALGIKYKFLRIYNLLGQLVAVIDISHLGPGMHNIKFEGRDNWGNELPSGIYICQLVVGNEVSAIRISLVK